MQVAEPKNPQESRRALAIEMCWHFCAHHEALLYCTIHYTEAQALSITYARISLPHASVVYGRNAEKEPVSRTKMADYRALVSMGKL